MSGEMLNVLVATLVAVGLNAIILLPVAKIVRRTGYSGWWSLLLFTGLGLVVGLYLLAYCRWPAFDPPAQPATRP
jgi:H+/Cl- antiporter ClcA